jgi:hypothetical protein
VLATIWIAAASEALLVGLWLQPAVIPVLLGLPSIAYGWLWSRVAMTRQRQE